jgi:RNA polymerase sigma factor (sigma-70 family)
MVDVQFTDTEYRVASGVAKRIARSQRYIVDVQDITQECHLWMCKNPSRVYEWREEGRKGKAKLSTAVYRAGMKYVVRERSRVTKTMQSDHAFYSDVVLSELLPNVFDPESWALESFQEESETRQPSRPAEGNTRLAMIIDVKFAFESLPEDDQVFIRNRFADGGMNVTTMAAVYDTHESTIRRKTQNILRKLSDKLGGEPPWV